MGEQQRDGAMIIAIGTGFLLGFLAGFLYFYVAMQTPLGG